MKFWRRNWYYIGGILFVGLAFVMGLWGSDCSGSRWSTWFSASLPICPMPLPCYDK